MAASTLCRPVAPLDTGRLRHWTYAGSSGASRRARAGRPGDAGPAAAGALGQLGSGPGGHQRGRHQLHGRRLAARGRQPHGGRRQHRLGQHHGRAARLRHRRPAGAAPRSYWRGPRRAPPSSPPPHALWPLSGGAPRRRLCSSWNRRRARAGDARGRRGPRQSMAASWSCPRPDLAGGVGGRRAARGSRAPGSTWKWRRTVSGRGPALAGLGRPCCCGSERGRKPWQGWRWRRWRWC